MRVLKTFLRPGWLLLGVFVVAFAAACFVILAPWQLGKNTDTEHRNDLIRSSESIAPAPLDQLAPVGPAFDSDHEWREVTATGRFLDDQQVLIRLRTAEQRPSVEVVTPFQIADSDRVVFVNRGWVRPGDGNTVDIAPAPAGQTTITGRLRVTESTSPTKGPRVENGVQTAYTIDTRTLGPVTGHPSEGFYLQLSPGQPASLGEIPLPQLDSGPYLSYGLQWLAFGVMVPLGAAYFIFSEVRARRRDRADADVGVDATPEPPIKERDVIRNRLRGAGIDSGNDLNAQDTAEIGGGAAGGSADVRDKLAQRYGK